MLSEITLINQGQFWLKRQSKNPWGKLRETEKQNCSHRKVLITVIKIGGPQTQNPPPNHFQHLEKKALSNLLKSLSAELH